MRIGIPREIKPREGRVALVPAATGELIKHGHDVYLQAGAGIASGYSDLDYRTLGVKIVDDAVTLYFETEMIVKVAEPVAAEYGLLREDHILFCFLHLAGNPELVTVLRDKGPYPVIVLSGEQGSAKSTFSAILRALLDPNSAPLRALPRNDRELFITATNGHVLMFDNVSGLPVWISDTFCRLATGGGFAVRQLYTDQDEVLFDAARPVVLNGIEDFVTRPDLADRFGQLPADHGDGQRMLPQVFGAELIRDSVILEQAGDGGSYGNVFHRRQAQQHDSPIHSADLTRQAVERRVDHFQHLGGQGG
ncbi:MAG: hypothetical protein IH808_09300, partial [Proteobacteria bacterium]|nr:hypothetical protein [Pseudomonadota bacterium]